MGIEILHVYMNDFLLGICLSVYPGLRNTCAELPKVVCSIASKSWEFTSKLLGKPWKLRFRDSQFQNFPGGACPRTPLDSSRLRHEIVPPNFNALAPPLDWHRIKAKQKLQATLGASRQVCLLCDYMIC